MGQNLEIYDPSKLFCVEVTRAGHQVVEGRVYSVAKYLRGMRLRVRVRVETRARVRVRVA